MERCSLVKAQIKFRVLEAIDPAVPKPILYCYQKEIEDLGKIEDLAEREKHINNIIKEINKHKEADKDDKK